MSEDIKKTISELHIYEKKLLKELEANTEATPGEIAENSGMDIKSVMSASGCAEIGRASCRERV